MNPHEYHRIGTDGCIVEGVALLGRDIEDLFAGGDVKAYRFEWFEYKVPSWSEFAVVFPETFDETFVAASDNF